MIAWYQIIVFVCVVGLCVYQPSRATTMTFDRFFDLLQQIMGNIIAPETQRMQRLVGRRQGVEQDPGPGSADMVIGQIQRVQHTVVVGPQRIGEVRDSIVADTIVVQIQKLQSRGAAAVGPERVGQVPGSVGPNFVTSQVQLLQRLVVGRSHSLGEEPRSVVADLVIVQVQLWQRVVGPERVGQELCSVTPDIVPSQVQGLQDRVGPQGVGQGMGSLGPDIIPSQVQRLQNRIGLQRVGEQSGSFRTDIVQG
jgi:hypothetical protein